jgi:subtilisin
VMLLVMAGANLLAAPLSPAPEGVPSPVNGKIDVLIGFEGTPNPGLVRAFGGEIYAEFTIVDVIAARIPQQVTDALQKRSEVSYVELDKPMYTTGQSLPWGIQRVFEAETYSFPTWLESKGAAIKVAVLDTGIDGSHEDLPSLKGGANTIDSTHWGSDGHGHGTHVAGTIAAADNSLGVIGVSPDIDLYAVKVLSDSGSGSTSTVIAGIEWAVNNNIHIVNMSLGGGGTTSLKDACDNAYEVGVLLVSSAGNSGNRRGTGDNVTYPAAYDSVIAVAASDSSDRRASFSSTGPAVELIAPGVSIESTLPGDKYGSYSGTSMASPHVAGVAALVWGANSGLSNIDVREILKTSAENLGLVSNHQGSGLVRADLAVAAVSSSDPGHVIYTITASAGEGGTITPSGEVKVAQGDDKTFTITPYDGYSINVLTVDGEAVDAPDGSYTFKDVQSNHTVSAAFELDNGAVLPSELYAKITSPASGTEYVWNSWVDITVNLIDQGGSPVSGAVVTVIVEGAGTYQGTTDANGNYTARHRVANRTAPGSYSITAVAEKNAIKSEADLIYFKVTSR